MLCIIMKKIWFDTLAGDSCLSILADSAVIGLTGQTGFEGDYIVQNFNLMWSVIHLLYPKYS